MADQNAPTIDAVLAAFGWKATQAGAAGTFIGWLLSSQGAALVGICGVFGGLFMQWYFRRRQDKREESEFALRKEEHEARMRGLQ